MTRRAGCLLGALLAAGSVAASSRGAHEGPWLGPILVSPGGRGIEGQVRTGCPGFSWAAANGATAYELLVYEVGEEAAGPDPAEEPVLRARIPAGATTFTPESEECLAAGRYAWVVGALLPGGGPRWSRPVTFRVEVEPVASPAPETRPPTTLIALSRSAPPPAEEIADPLPRVVTAEAFAPSVCTPGDEMFPDVPASDPFCLWIEQLARDGITSGCGGGNYCPDDPVSRRQLARFLERSMRGTTTWAPAQGTNVLAPPADNQTWTVDFAANDTGQYTSITIGADGLPIISYWDATASAVKVAHCNDLACLGQNETISTVDDQPNNIGASTSITIGADGRPIISYRDGSALALALKVTHCNDVACAGNDETTTTVDNPANNVGWNSSITIGADGLPIISYWDLSAGTLKVAHCNDVACAGVNETITTVDDPANNVGSYSSITIGADGLPIISYRDLSAGTLKVAHCNDVACAGVNETITTVDNPANTVGLFTSITIGADGLPIISYGDAGADALKVVHCNDVACAGNDETITTVDDPANSVRESTSITIGADGLPIISYYDATAGALKVAHCNDVACAGVNETITTVDDAANSVGEFNSITIGADGLPIISYYDSTAGHLKVAHCANVFCTPYFRRR